MLTESYNKITSYLTETFGANFLILSILLTTAVSITYFILMSYIITQMDKRYFIRNSIIVNKTDKKNVDAGPIAPPPLSANKSSITFVINISRIIIGVFLLLCGIVMLVLPGQGLITMIIGLSLLPFPGKNKIVKKLLARRSVRNSLNWVRYKAKKEPFIFD